MEFLNLILNTVNIAAIIFIAVRYVNKTDKNTEEIYKFRYNYLDRFNDVGNSLNKVKEEIQEDVTVVKEQIATLLERTKQQ